MAQALPPATVAADPQRVLRGALAGDPRARRALVATHERAVFHLLGRMLAPAGLAALVEDLAQETFIRALLGLDRFDPAGPAKFSTWLLTIASRLAINELKRRRPRTESIEAWIHSLAGYARADDDQRRRAVAVAIGRALATLGPEFRAAFVLREYHELSHAEIADALGVAVGTVKSRVARARAQLREALEDHRHDR